MTSDRSWKTWLHGSLARAVAVDLIVLLGVVGLIGCSWVFYALARGVVLERPLLLDERLLLAFRRPGQPGVPVGPAWLPEAVRDVTALGSVTVLAVVTGFVIGLLLLCRKTHVVALVTAAVLGGSLLSVGMKAAFSRPRPTVVRQLAEVSSASFPSGHAQMSAVTYLTLGAILARLVTGKRLKAYIVLASVLLTFCVGLSRIYLGVHYPSDVLAGWSLGIVWALLCWLAARQLQARQLVEPLDVAGGE